MCVKVVNYVVTTMSFEACILERAHEEKPMSQHHCLKIVDMTIVYITNHDFNFLLIQQAFGDFFNIINALFFPHVEFEIDIDLLLEYQESSIKNAHNYRLGNDLMMNMFFKASSITSSFLVSFSPTLRICYLKN